MDERTQDPRAGQRATFVVLRTGTPDAADRCLAGMARQAREHHRGLPGFVSARLHREDAGRAAVLRTLWDRTAATGPEAAVSSLRTLGEEPGVGGVFVFDGVSAAGLAGPAMGDPPGKVAVAVRHLHHAEAMKGLLGLLAASGEWKRHFPGFISATPYLGNDGRTFVNYPMWTGDSAYRAWMADARIAEGQDEIALLEAAPPEYLVCTVTDQVDRRGSV
ncbi:hypothetical protein ACFV3R_28950 [Streptomyces sp. NPDC059740]|uniref:hypothetical protein n=1 Tax=Streptomyces sp. NPDC059740 TaxID=3346926 RepID=UPI00365B05EC